MLREFKEFAMRGNVLDMAIGIIIGGAFGVVVGGNETGDHHGAVPPCVSASRGSKATEAETPKRRG